MTKNKLKEHMVREGFCCINCIHINYVLDGAKCIKDGFVEKVFYTSEYKEWFCADFHRIKYEGE